MKRACLLTSEAEAEDVPYPYYHTPGANASHALLVLIDAVFPYSLFITGELALCASTTTTSSPSTICQQPSSEQQQQ
jgi:hypothetical protein